MRTSDQINDIAAALAKAQGAMRPALKDATNPHFKSKYADLAANVEAAREPLSANGLAVLQEATTTERGIAVATRIVHSSGQWIEFDPLTVPLSKADAHGVGSATTYARRYALGAALGLVADDDDGNAAVQPANGAAQRAQTPKAPAGYDDWLTNFIACADSGLDDLRKMFRESKPEYRNHLTRHDGKQYEKATARATEVSKKQAVPA